MDQQILQTYILRFEITAGGPTALEKVIVSALVERSAIGRQRLALRCMQDVLHIIVEAHLFDVNPVLTQPRKDVPYVRLRLEVVYPVHQQDIGRYVESFKIAFVDVQQQPRKFALLREVLCVVVPVSEMNGKTTRAVRPLPFKFRRHLFLPADTVHRLVESESASEHKCAKSELTDDLRKLRNIPELVGSISDRAALAELLCDRRADHEIAHGRLAVGEIEIVLQIPRPHTDIPRGDILLQLFLVPRMNGKIIFQHDGLCVQMEDVITVSFENAEQPIDQIDQLHAEYGERHIPFSVPVRMGNHDKFFHLNSFPLMFGKPVKPTSRSKGGVYYDLRFFFRSNTTTTAAQSTPRTGNTITHTVAAVSGTDTGTSMRSTAVKPSASLKSTSMYVPFSAT